MLVLPVYRVGFVLVVSASLMELHLANSLVEMFDRCFVSSEISDIECRITTRRCLDWCAGRLIYLQVA